MERDFSSRAVIAHIFMLAAILLLGVGLALLHPGIGIAAAGLASGIYGYLLGAE